MNIETETTITENSIGFDCHELHVTVRHNHEYECGFLIKLGCVNEYLTSGDLRTLVRVFNKALRVRKEAAK